METNNQIKNIKNFEIPELERKGIFHRYYHSPSQMPVKKKEYYFSDDLKDVQAILEQHKFNSLKGLHCKTLSPVEMVVVGTKDGQYAAVQLFHYVPYTFEPVSEIMVFNGSDAAALLDNLKEVKVE